MCDELTGLGVIAKDVSAIQALSDFVVEDIIVLHVV